MCHLYQFLKKSKRNNPQAIYSRLSVDEVNGLAEQMLTDQRLPLNYRQKIAEAIVTLSSKNK